MLRAVAQQKTPLLLGADRASTRACGQGQLHGRSRMFLIAETDSALKLSAWDVDLTPSWELVPVECSKCIEWCCV